MRNRYDGSEARAFAAARPEVPLDLALRVHTSRLLGAEPALVLHGGGNTSVKTSFQDLLGRRTEALYVKGSGWDLATIEAPGFTPLDLAPLRLFRRLPALGDEAMMDGLLVHRLDARSPNPSVETLLHAWLPHRFVDHTHADAVVVLTAVPEGPALAARVFGARTIVLPYLMPGFPLAKAVADAFDGRREAQAVVLCGHGLFTFGESAEESYGRMIERVTLAEEFIAEKTVRAARLPACLAGRQAAAGGGAQERARVGAVLRGACAYAAPAADGVRRFRFLAEWREDPDLVAAASDAPLAARLARLPVLTPDHVVRTKNRWLHLPEVPSDDAALAEKVRAAVGAFAADYRAYVASGKSARGRQVVELDPFPRVALVAGLGLFALGFTKRDARIAADLAAQSVRAKALAEPLGGFQGLSDLEVFDVEYWPLEQAKLGKGAAPPLRGFSALVTGGGGAIARGVAERLLAEGAAVALLDIRRDRLDLAAAALRESRFDAEIVLLEADVADSAQVARAFAEVSRALGGVDLVVDCAGIAAASPIEEMDLGAFRRVVEVNLTGAVTVLREAARLFRRQGSGGDVVLVTSKNVFEPGASFGAYSASKAGQHQIGRIAAMELAPLDVRVNMIAADAIFGDAAVPSALWEEVGPERMRARGLSPKDLRAYYRDRNLLKAEVTAQDVGNAVVFFATRRTPTTGASLPVDGGLPGAFPR